MNIPKFKKLRIEINSDCNRKCVFCPRGTDSTRWVGGAQSGKRKKLIDKKMSTENVLSLIDQNVEQGFNAEIGFDFYNEITLDERLFYFCDYAKSKGLSIEVVTNGDKMLGDSEYTKELFRLTNFVNISLYDYKDMAGRDRLCDKWRKFLSSCGIPQGRYRLVGDYTNFGNRAGLVKRKEKYMQGASLDHKVPLHANCKKIHSKMNIRYDGEVPICCEDSHVRYSLGNALKTSLADVWYGQKMQDATKLLRAGNRAAILPCSACVKSIVPVNRVS